MTPHAKAIVRKYAINPLNNPTVFAPSAISAKNLSQSDASFESDRHKADHQQVCFQREILNAWLYRRGRGVINTMLPS